MKQYNQVRSRFMISRSYSVFVSSLTSSGKIANVLRWRLRSVAMRIAMPLNWSACESRQSRQDGKMGCVELTSTLFLEALGRLVPVAKQEEPLANFGRLKALGHDVERDSLSDLEALAIKVVLPFRVVSRGDGAD